MDLDVQSFYHSSWNSPESQAWGGANDARGTTERQKKQEHRGVHQVMHQALPDSLASMPLKVFHSISQLHRNRMEAGAMAQQ